jgi:hypothetical protein
MKKTELFRVFVVCVLIYMSNVLTVELFFVFYYSDSYPILAKSISSLLLGSALLFYFGRMIYAALGATLLVMLVPSIKLALNLWSFLLSGEIQTHFDAVSVIAFLIMCGLFVIWLPGTGQKKFRVTASFVVVTLFVGFLINGFVGNLIALS